MSQKTGNGKFITVVNSHFIIRMDSYCSHRGIGSEKYRKVRRCLKFLRNTVISENLQNMGDNLTPEHKAIQMGAVLTFQKHSNEGYAYLNRISKSVKRC